MPVVPVLFCLVSEAQFAASLIRALALCFVFVAIPSIACPVQVASQPVTEGVLCWAVVWGSRWADNMAACADVGDPEKGVCCKLLFNGSCAFKSTDTCKYPGHSPSPCAAVRHELR